MTLTELLPLDLSATIHTALGKSKRVPDGLLHCSSDLTGSLRHTMLKAAGAPTIENDIVSDIILETGTLWHKRIAQLLVDSGSAFMQEVNLTPWLPTGWAGTADWLFWNPEYEAFVLGDLKTVAGEGLQFIERDGIKTEHHHQLSAYWYACVEAGLPMVEHMVVMYFPKNRAKNYDTRPIEVEAKPLDGEYMRELMAYRWEYIQDYLDSIDYLADAETAIDEPDWYKTDLLSPVQARELKLIWNKDKYEVKLVPHWSAQFCPFPDELCDCNTQGENKIGEYELSIAMPSGISEVVYRSRRGYEDIIPPDITRAQEKRILNAS